MLRPDEHQFWRLLSTGEFKLVAQDVVWKKLVFFFGDRIKAGDDFMTEGITKWVREIDNQWYFPPAQVRKYSITSLHRLTLTNEIVGVLSRRLREFLPGVLVSMVPYQNLSEE